MTNLTEIFLSGNELNLLVVPPDMAALTSLVLNGNPLATLVLPETLASGALSPTVSSLRNQGISVFTYPLQPQLSAELRASAHLFDVSITGPPGQYEVLGSDDLSAWSHLSTVTNTLGIIQFDDPTAAATTWKFYRVRSRP
jgi:hypothetical protein